MPTKSQHLRQATHNEKFFDDFDLTHSEFTDWAVVVLFYSALHYVEAFFAQHKIHCNTHAQRDPEINKRLSGLYIEYSDLKNDAVEARYKMKKFTTDEIKSNIMPTFDTIKAAISAKLT